VNLRQILSRQQLSSLSPDILRVLVSDLQSADPARAKQWEYYFQHLIELQSDFESKNFDLDNLSALYKSREAPARSNYFGDVVQTLRARQQTVGLSKGTMVAYLGKPDETRSTPEGEVLSYRFTSLGSPAVAVIDITNNKVAQVLVSVQAAADGPKTGPN
jgi:hypothetical protein